VLANEFLETKKKLLVNSRVKGMKNSLRTNPNWNYTFPLAKHVDEGFAFFETATVIAGPVKLRRNSTLMITEMIPKSAEHFPNSLFI